MSIAAETDGKNAARPACRAVPLIYLFFFVSGMPALIYQLAWQRVLFRIFGLSMDSITVIVTAFMLGLGAGSLAGSWLSQWSRRPLLLVAVIELAAALFGAFSMPLFAHVDPLVQEMALAQRTFVIIAIVFIPTSLMGATLPLLIGRMVRQSGNVGLSAGSLYRINALGAVAGCVISALLLFPFLGLQASVLFAAACNLVVAAISLTAHTVDRQDIAASPFDQGPAATKPLAMLPATMLVFLSGFISLSFEIYYLHLVSFASGTNALVMSVTLAAFLLGIASGAGDAAQWSNSGEPDLSPVLCRTLLASGIAGLAVLPLASLGFLLDRGIIGLIALATFFTARSLGVVFPLVTQLAVPASAAAGRRAGLLYLTNIAGSGVGCLLTGFVLCDLLGIRALAMLLSALALSLGGLLILHFGPARRTFLIIPSGAVLLLALFQGPLTRNAVESMLYKRETPRHPPLARVVENRYGIVAESPDGTVYGGGIYDGHFNTNLVHDVNGIVRAYSLSLFHPAPRQVFMIGLASGSWAQAIAANPMVQHLTVVEINPAYLPLIREQAQVASLLSNPKVSIIIDDANRWLRRHPDSRYDAVVANATYHFRANATTLLSREFDGLIAQHLARGGVYIYNTTDSVRVQTTGCENFRDGYRLFNFMVMGTDLLSVDAARWRANLLATRIDGHPILDLGKKEDARQLDHLMMIPAYAHRLSPDPARQPLESCSSVMRRSAGANPVTDDNMGTEWRYPLGLD